MIEPRSIILPCNSEIKDSSSLQLCVRSSETGSYLAVYLDDDYFDIQECIHYIKEELNTYGEYYMQIDGSEHRFIMPAQLLYNTGIEV